MRRLLDAVASLLEGDEVGLTSSLDFSSILDDGITAEGQCGRGFGQGVGQDAESSDTGGVVDADFFAFRVDVDVRADLVAVGIDESGVGLVGSGVTERRLSQFILRVESGDSHSWNSSGHSCNNGSRSRENRSRSSENRCGDSWNRQSMGYKRSRGGNWNNRSGDDGDGSGLGVGFSVRGGSVGFLGRGIGFVGVFFDDWNSVDDRGGSNHWNFMGYWNSGQGLGENRNLVGDGVDGLDSGESVRQNWNVMAHSVDGRGNGVESWEAVDGWNSVDGRIDGVDGWSKRVSEDLGLSHSNLRDSVSYRQEAVISNGQLESGEVQGG